MSSFLDVEVEQSVGWIRIRRPEVRNALTPQLASDLAAAIHQLADDQTLRVCVLTGADGSFCSGLDLKHVATEPAALANAEGALDGFQDIVRAVVFARIPFVAAVGGPAAGFGFDLALACDMRVASEAAFFESSFVRMGLVPDGGSTFWLPRLVGPGRARAMVMFSERVSASDALALGMVQRVVAPGDLDEAGRELAARIAAAPFEAVVASKALLSDAVRGELEKSLEREKRAQLQRLADPGFRQRLAGFVGGGKGTANAGKGE